MSESLDTVRDILDVASSVVRVVYKGVPSGEVKDAVSGADMILRGIVQALDEGGASPQDILRAIGNIPRWDTGDDDTTIDAHIGRLPKRDSE